MSPELIGNNHGPLVDRYRQTHRKNHPNFFRKNPLACPSFLKLSHQDLRCEWCGCYSGTRIHRTHFAQKWTKKNVVMLEKEKKQFKIQKNMIFWTWGVFFSTQELQFHIFLSCPGICFGTMDDSGGCVSDANPDGTGQGCSWNMPKKTVPIKVVDWFLSFRGW